MIPDPSNPQAWNRYSYVYGNPLRYTDPTGHEVCDEDGNCFNQGRKYRSRSFDPLDRKSKSTNGGGGRGRDDDFRGVAETTGAFVREIFGPSNPSVNLMNYENDYTYLYKKYQNPTGTVTPMHFLHRSNYSTIVPVYQNNKITGYHYVDVYIDPSSIRVDLSIFTPNELLSRGYDYAIGQNIEYLAEISGNTTLSTVAKKASLVSTAYDVVTTINDIVTFDGYLVWSSFIPYPPQETNFPSYDEIFSIPGTLQ